MIEILKNRKGIILFTEDDKFIVQDNDCRETDFFTLDVAEEFFNWLLFQEMYS